MEVPEIDLGHLIAVKFAAVLDGESHLHFAIRGNLRTQLAVPVVKFRVAQAMTKRIERSALEITLGAVAH